MSFHNRLSKLEANLPARGDDCPWQPGLIILKPGEPFPDDTPCPLCGEWHAPRVPQLCLVITEVAVDAQEPPAAHE